MTTKRTMLTEKLSPWEVFVFTIAIGGHGSCENGKSNSNLISTDLLSRGQCFRMTIF